jgi:hypothetical protein
VGRAARRQTAQERNKIRYAEEKWSQRREENKEENEKHNIEETKANRNEHPEEHTTTNRKKKKKKNYIYIYIYMNSETRRAGRNHHPSVFCTEIQERVWEKTDRKTHTD